MILIPLIQISCHRICAQRLDRNEGFIYKMETRCFLSYTTESSNKRTDSPKFILCKIEHFKTLNQNWQKHSSNQVQSGSDLML